MTRMVDAVTRIREFRRGQGSRAVPAPAADCGGDGSEGGGGGAGQVVAAEPSVEDTVSGVCVCVQGTRRGARDGAGVGRRGSLRGGGGGGGAAREDGEVREGDGAGTGGGGGVCLGGDGPLRRRLCGGRCLSERYERRCLSGMSADA